MTELYIGLWHRCAVGAVHGFPTVALDGISRVLYPRHLSMGILTPTSAQHVQWKDYSCEDFQTLVSTLRGWNCTSILPTATLYFKRMKILSIIATSLVLCKLD